MAEREGRKQEEEIEFDAALTWSGDEVLRERDFEKAQIAYLLGNTRAQRSYERVGFKTVYDRRDPDFKAALDCPGIACMHLDL